jgi:positive regulator of sigma E activity
LNTSRFIIGLILIAIAVAIFLFSGENYSTSGAVALGVLGFVSIAISRRKQSA